MVAKKKGLYLGLLLSLFGTGNGVQAYKIIIKNRTGLPAKIKVNYLGQTKRHCRPRFKKLGPREDIEFDAGSCELGKVEADISVRDVKVLATPYVPVAGLYKRFPHCGYDAELYKRCPNYPNGHDPDEDKVKVIVIVKIGGKGIVGADGLFKIIRETSE